MFSLSLTGLSSARAHPAKLPQWTRELSANVSLCGRENFHQWRRYAPYRVKCILKVELG